MDIVINLDPLYNFLALPVEEIVWKLFWTVGWMPIALTFIWGSAQLWLFYIRTQWGRTQKFILLAIDVPRGNAQSPKGVENIFSYLAGAHATFDLWEKWWLGEFQLSFSLEIIGIEGYIQFLVRTPSHFKNLVESAIYSQYPDAEITEVNDYIEGFPTKFPDDQYDIWGGEYKLVKKSYYPIKIYKDFEHIFGEPETQYKDPMAVLMDLMSSLKKGEQIWYQIILIPIDQKWADEAEKEIKKIIGEKNAVKDNFLDKILDGFIKLLGSLGDLFFTSEDEVKKEDKRTERQELQFLMMTLKPKQKNQIEAIQEKVNKLGHGVKIRFVYIAKKEVMNKPKSANGFTGYIKQFNTNDGNSFKPDVGELGTATKVNYPIFKEVRLNARKRRIMRAYKLRDDTAGRTPFILNIEELATIWHFPVESVAKAPLIQKAPGRKAEPPASLPFAKTTSAAEILFKEKGSSGVPDFFNEIEVAKTKIPQSSEQNNKRGEPPANLPLA